MASRIADAELLALPLFAGLAPGDAVGLHEHLDVEEHPRGTRLFRRGDAGDALYVVLSGQVAVELPAADTAQLLELFGPGDWFGELALLGGGIRSADARVVVDARLLRVDRTGWTALGERAPHVFARLCERMGRQLRAGNERRRPAKRAIVACGEAGFRLPAWVAGLAASVRRQFPGREVHLLDAGVVPDGGAIARALAGIVAQDALVLVPAAATVLADRRLRCEGATEWVLDTVHDGGPARRIRGASEDATLDRVARHVAGGTVGLALGAGGAFGFAHLGLLEALSAAGVPIDYVAGTSMGAIVGALFAAGVPTAELLAVACDLASRYRGILLSDLDLRGRTLLTGAAVMRLLGEFARAREATFDALEVPFVAIAMDVAAGQEVVLDAGPLLDGIRPSFAMPGVFPPCVSGARVLVDGAMANPVPVDRVRALGADVVIASQPIPPLQPGGADPLGSVLGRARWLGGVLPLGGVRGWLQTLSVSLRSYQALWYQLARASVVTADAAVQPDLRAFWFLQFGAAGALADAGRTATEAAMPGIVAVLEDRVGLVIARRA